MPPRPRERRRNDRTIRMLRSTLIGIVSIIIILYIVKISLTVAKESNMTQKDIIKILERTCKNPKVKKMANSIADMAEEMSDSLMYDTGTKKDETIKLLLSIAICKEAVTTIHNRGVECERRRERIQE